MPTFGLRSDDLVRDSRGDVAIDLKQTFYATRTDAEMQANALGTATSAKDGRWEFTHPATGVFGRDPEGNIRFYDSEEPKLTEAAASGLYALKGESGGSRASAIQSLASYGAGAWFIKRVAATDYRLIRDLGDGSYLQQTLECPSSLPGGGNLVHQLTFTALGVPMLSVDEDDVATFSGTWARSQVTATTGYKSRSFTGAAITSGSAVLTVTGGSFVSTDVGRRITIVGAGASGADLSANIVTFTSATQVSVSTSAGTTVSGSTATLWAEARYSTAAGDTATWTSPASTSLGVINVITTNGGLLKVSVDGSTTAATALPTAQSKVDDGSYPNTILAANGGSLQPTDRVLDCYSSSTNWANRVAIASGLPNTTHTVVLTSTGYTRNGATGNRAYVTGFTYATGAETPLTANTDIVQSRSLAYSYSAFEYAYEVTPTGGSTRTFIGSVHGYEIEDTFTLTIDGAAVTMTDGETRAVGSFAEFKKATRLRHPDTGSTDQATIATTYRLDQRGLTVRHTDNWLVAQTVFTAFPVMFPVSGLTFDKAKFDTGAALTAADFTGSGAHKPGVAGEQATAVALWDTDGKTAAAVIVPTAKAITFGWASSYAVYVEDRAQSGTEKLNKVYFASVGNGTKAVAPGDVWQSEALYLWARMPAGADPVMSTVA